MLGTSKWDGYLQATRCPLPYAEAGAEDDHDHDHDDDDEEEDDDDDDDDEEGGEGVKDPNLGRASTFLFLKYDADTDLNLL